MPETPTPTFLEPTEPVAEETETETEDTEQIDFEQYPEDHPLVKAFVAQKTKLHARQARLDQIEEERKLESEKASLQAKEVEDRLAQADAAVAGIPAKVCEALKAHLIVLHGIEQEDADLLLTATEPDLLLKQAERLVGQSGKRKNYVPREGSNPNPSPSDPTREFLRSINGQV
jgi:hypothetical protein